jgi:hypothetical protein
LILNGAADQDAPEHTFYDLFFPGNHLPFLKEKVGYSEILKVQFADIWPLFGHFLVLLVLDEIDFYNR